ncbi:MAG TPA: alpha/beta hydrolase [Mycobacteriales bacterium]|nr:alpha/beta hydrolase [Mycobacteriales bacterium]
MAGWHKGEGELLALVLHGGPGLSDYTADLCEEVLEGGDGHLRVARYQQRGAPPSSVEGPFTVAQLVDDAVGVLDHLGASTAMLVGHSWGSHLAMHIAVARPERVEALLLLDSLGAVGDGGTGTMAGIIGGRLEESVRAEVAALEDRSDLSDDERGTRQLSLMLPGYFKDPASAPAMPPITVHHLAGSVMNDAMRLLAEGALEGALPSLDVPSLHLIGAHSPMEPAANQRTASLMRHAIVDVRDVGHFAWLEEPGSVAAATRRLRKEMADAR